VKHSRAPAPVGGLSERQTSSYEEAVALHGHALERLARSYELDPDKRQDLLQEIHLNLWRSLARFDGRCSLRTWVYRVAHNVASSHVMQARRRKSFALVGLEDLEDSDLGIEPAAARGVLVAHLMELLRRLRPLDRELVILYMEGLGAAEIGEVVGISAGNVATKLSRIKKILAGYAGKESTHGD
jgi:RNA polymerase sigma-70 factor, ECF subfamily